MYGLSRKEANNAHGRFLDSIIMNFHIRKVDSFSWKKFQPFIYSKKLSKLPALNRADAGDTLGYTPVIEQIRGDTICIFTAVS